MRLVHSLVVTPNHAGLYETAKDLMLAEERLGHLAVAMEPDGSSKDMNDSEIAVATGDIRAQLLSDADVIIDHSGCDKQMLESGVPIIHMRHGRPLASFLSSMSGIDVYSHMAKIGKDERYRGFVTFWQDHVPYWEAVIGKPVKYIPACVDLERFHPSGPKHGFNGHAGKYNVVIADMWREDACPFEVIQQFRELSDGMWKLHLYGVKKRSKPLNTLLDTLGDQVGEVGWSQGMANIYRAADLVMSGSGIYTRVIREALACGCPVQHPNGVFMQTREQARLFARANFDPDSTAGRLIQYAEESIGATVG